MSKRKNTSVHRIEVNSHRQPFAWMNLLLVAFTFFLYFNTLQHEFAFDDSVVITGNKYTQQGFSGIKTLVTKDLFYGIYGTSLDLEGGRWRPLSLVLFAIEYQWWGENPFPYHLMNVLLYALSALVLFKMLAELFASYKQTINPALLSFLTTLLFIAHPIHTEVVANIKSRDEILSFLFLLLCIRYLLQYVRRKTTYEKGSIPLLLLSVVFYFMALLSKENGITFLAVIPLVLFMIERVKIKKTIHYTIPFFIAAIIYLVIRTSLVGMIGDRQSNDVTDNPFLQLNFPALPTPIPFADKLATVLWILMKYLILLLFPHPLTSDYGFNELPVIHLLHPQFILSFIVYASLMLFSLKHLLLLVKTEGGIKHNELHNPIQQTLKNIVVFSFLYFFITILIVSNLFFLIGTTLGERFAYTSSLGYCLALAATALHFTRSWKQEVSPNLLKNSKLALPLLLILFLYSFKTIRRNLDWKNNTTLFTADVTTSKRSANAHYYYANTLFTQHLNDAPSPTRDSIFGEAKNEFRKAMQINPYFHYSYYNIGLIWEKLGNADSAIFYHQKTIHLKPDNTMAQYMAKGALGLVYGKLKGDVDKAIPLLKESSAWKPDDASYRENLGICYAMKGDWNNSIHELEQAIQLKSASSFKKEDGRLFLNLALSFQNKGDKQKADESYQKAFALDPALKK
jgi:protein O-mannosyl-transferase